MKKKTDDQPIKRGKGRPRFVPTDEQVKQIAKLYGLGLTYDQLAGFLELSPTCFDELLERQPEIKRAISKAKAGAIGSISSTLFKQAQEGNLTAAIFYLKTQGRWAEAREQANSDDVATSSFTLNYLSSKKDE